MLRVDLSVLSRAELRRLLDQARSRGQAGLADQLQGELDARASGGVAKSPPKPPADEDEPGPMLLPDDPFPEPDDLRLESVRTPVPARRRSMAPAVAAVVAAFGLAFGWGFLGAPGLPRPGPPEPAPVPAPGPAQAAPRGAPAAVPETPRAEVARLTPPAAPAAEPAPPPPEEKREARAASAPATAVDAVSRPRRLDPCATPPTPADRLLCHDLALNLLERELRDAYGRALDSGVDPVLLRADQAAWRAERDPVGDPHVLARLYDRRIRDLEAQAKASVRD